MCCRDFFPSVCHGCLEQFDADYFLVSACMCVRACMYLEERGEKELERRSVCFLFLIFLTQTQPGFVYVSMHTPLLLNKKDEEEEEEEEQKEEEG